MIEINKSVFVYDCFEKWRGYDNIYIYSDPHFADQDVKFLRHNFISDDEQVKRINSVCHKNDILIILGDIGDVNYIAKLKAGYKVLIKGNHDSGIINYKKSMIDGEISTVNFTDDEIEKTCNQLCKKRGIVYVKQSYSAQKITFEYNNNLFDEIYDGVLSLNGKIILSHEPIDVTCLGETCMLNIHGHVHEKSYTDQYHINCCAEHIDYRPINLSSVVVGGFLTNIKTIHRITIDNATQNPTKRHK